MAFNNRVPVPLDPAADPNLPQADASQAHDIPTGVSPTTAKLQDWIAWLRTNSVNVVSSGLQTIVGSLRIETFLSLTQNISASSDPGANLFHKDHFPKIWCHISTDGAGGYTIHDGINVGLASVTATYVDVSMVRGFASKDYAAFVTSMSNNAHRPNVDWLNSTASVVRLQMRDAAGSIIDPSAIACRWSLVAMGRF